MKASKRILLFLYFLTMSWVVAAVACYPVDLVDQIHNYPLEFAGTSAVVLILAWVDR